MDIPPIENQKTMQGVEDINYWREKAEEYKRNWETEREDFRDFQISSKELEGELETQLEVAEKKNDELRAALERLSIELENTTSRYESTTASQNRQLTSLQEELNNLKSEKAQQQVYIRKLEQTNDDLERSKRTALASVEDFENSVNKLIERNALLEGELDEKQELLESVQRLKDEVRDLNQELVVRRLPTTNEATSVEPVMDDPEKVSKSTIEASTQTANIKEVSARSSLPSSLPLNPSTRIGALNLVGELLQKVGQLEANFANVCRCYDVSPAKVAKLNDVIVASSTANGV
ncbi:unnamed protein product [Dibothriocephalus latus]|uniref:NUDE domain-containing protein n=1 Tax=Dibothriocephalus latus TaxID=60516 RepID=A0A3P7LVY3_DIBLA|nr:unnamed protein product [Dibothriocephalus latus]